jgi:hypothetical protein
LLFFTGDLTGDGWVNLLDYSLFTAHWLQTGCNSSNSFCGGADINQDGRVDLRDLSQLVAHWLQGG